MKWASPFLCVILLSGCYYLGQNTYRDVVLRPSTGWSGPECLTVIMGAANHNLQDPRTVIKVIATPYYPSVVKAIGRRAQTQYHWKDGEFHQYVDRLVSQSSGMFIDWERPEEPVFDGSLKPLESPTQFDSLMFLLTFQVRGWTSQVLGIQVPVPGTDDTVAQFIPLQGPDALSPVSSDMKNGTILLFNEKGESIPPAMVWGKRMNYLTTNEESMFAKFILRRDGRHFLEDSRRMFLTVRGYEQDIRLEFQTGFMR